MKIVHLSDLHIGAKIDKEERIEEFQEIFSFIKDFLKKESVKILFITGDVFDSYYPSHESLDLFYGFMKEVSDIVEKTFIISGNHDSSSFLGVNRHFFNERGIKIFYDISEDFNNLKEEFVIDGEKILVQGLPYINDVKILYTILKNKGLEGVNISEYKSIYDGIISVFKNIAKSSDANYKVFMAHLLIDIPLSFTSEVEIFSLDPSIFQDNPYNYVALGHVHRFSKINRLDNIYYAGSLLRLNFGEKNDEKGFILIDTSSNSVKFILVPAWGMQEVELNGVSSLLDLEKMIDIKYKDKTIYKFRISYKSPLTYSEIIDYLKKNYGNMLRLEAKLVNRGYDKSDLDIFQMDENDIILNFYKRYKGVDDDNPLLIEFKNNLLELLNEN